MQCLLLLFPLVFAPQTPLSLPVEVRVALEDVVDGDTLRVTLDGESVALRLLGVDTEEKISGRPQSSPTKPQTVFGEETSLWAKELFAALSEPRMLGLAFPEGRRLDGYGRLLAHVILPDGRDYNLLLVEGGWSPYFNKYGNDRALHAAFVRAQEEAQTRGLGIWNAATNRARTPGAPSARRPYEELLPWWQARADAVEGFRARAARAPERFISHEDAAGLRAAAERCAANHAVRVTVFGAVERFFEEPDGALTVLLRSGDRTSALRAHVPAAARAALEPSLRASSAEFRQNYLYVQGRLLREKRGFHLHSDGPDAWRVAEPAYPR